MLKNVDLIFESYNAIIEESYNKAFAQSNTEDLLKIKDEDVSQYLIDDLKKWETLPQEALDGLSPLEYFNSITDFEDTIELFRSASNLCDSGLPSLLVEKLKTYGAKAEDVLLELASDKAMIESQEDFYVPLMAIKVMGEWGIDRAINTLLKILLAWENENDLIIEEIASALANIGEAAVKAITDAVENAEAIEYKHECLLDALVRIGRSSKSEDIYRCLKSSFLKMDNKILGAAFLGDYGDGRAVTFLRGYAEKNKEKIDNKIFYEIKSAVQRLGGNMDDLDRR